jgi:hypothetical protein
MPFKGYDEVAKEPIVLPIHGKEYTLPEVKIADGIRFNEVLSGLRNEPLSDLEFMRTFLGDTYDQMLADNIPAPAVMRAALTAVADWQAGRAAAEIIWDTDASPKGLTELVESLLPNRKARRASKPTGAATTTKPRASTSGTKTSRAS